MGPGVGSRVEAEGARPEELGTERAGPEGGVGCEGLECGKACSNKVGSNREMNPNKFVYSVTLTLNNTPS